MTTIAPDHKGPATSKRFITGSGDEVKDVICASCDGFCPVSVKVRDGRVVKVTSRDTPILEGVLCMKGAYAPKSFAHPDRLMRPLKRVGERGGGQWQEVSWDDALDDIAARLTTVVERYGPEAFAMATSDANIGLDNGLSRRFMNHLGSPNWIGGVAYCMGNTAAVSRLVYGWYPRSDIMHSDCIVLMGHDPRRHSWTLEHKSIRMAQARGAKLIVVDPRRSGNADLSDLWLPIRAGTDTALLFGWLNVIIEEELYDADFVREWTVGFDQFAERIRQFPVSRVAEMTGLDAELIVESARMYATSRSACFPWTPITDQLINSTSAIRLQCSLRAITGNLDVKGGEVFVGFNPAVRSDTEIEMHDVLPQEQKDKQLGAQDHPAFTYRAQMALNEPTLRVWGHKWANLVSGCYMANPMAVFKAMAEEDPYPVKAFFALANNTLMSFANTKRIYDALMAQDLFVVYEHAMTPTAQVADYVLPGDSWLERPGLLAGISDQAMEPPGECQSVVYFWHGLAQRMGMGEVFPWQTGEEFLDYRVEPSGQAFADVVAAGRFPSPDPEPAPSNTERKYLKTGFATPSGKVELYSSILDDLGFDPLPYYRQTPQSTDEYPMQMFIGLPDDEYYRTGQRHVPEFRKRAKDPTFYLSAADAASLGVDEGGWARVTTSIGTMVGRVFIRSTMPDGLVRVPHGWWKPESRKGLENMSGMWDFSDAQLTSDDDPDFIDREQGIPQMKGCPCRIDRLPDDEVARLEAEYGPTEHLPKGPEGTKTRPVKLPEFLDDHEMSFDVEFEAVELSIYGRITL